MLHKNTFILFLFFLPSLSNLFLSFIFFSWDECPAGPIQVWLKERAVHELLEKWNACFSNQSPTELEIFSLLVTVLSPLTSTNKIHFLLPRSHNFSFVVKNRGLSSFYSFKFGHQSSFSFNLTIKSYNVFVLHVITHPSNKKLFGVKW
jgi:hypothetical protein